MTQFNLRNTGVMLAHAGIQFELNASPVPACAGMTFLKPVNDRCLIGRVLRLELHWGHAADDHQVSVQFSAEASCSGDAD